MKDQYNKIRELLPTGECNAIHLIRLSEILDSNTKLIKKSIQDMRLNGEPICSSSKGYYISDDPKYTYEWTKTLENRAFKSLKVVRAMRGNL